jgi:hypothetical protein
MVTAPVLSTELTEDRNIVDPLGVIGGIYAENTRAVEAHIVFVIPHEESSPAPDNDLGSKNLGFLRGLAKHGVTVEVQRDPIGGNHIDWLPQ